jgi:hypothetical protein
VVAAVVKYLSKIEFLSVFAGKVIVAFLSDFQMPILVCHLSLWFQLLLVVLLCNFLCFQNT